MNHTRLARVLVIAALLLIPLRIIGYGALPGDDARRHAAKVLSGKDWSEIVLLRPDMAAVDTHPGWHLILDVVHRATAADGPALVWFSVVFLFVIASLAPVLLLRRAEAWLLALLVLAVADPAVLGRLLQGRPLLWSTGVVAALALLWPRFAGEHVERRWIGAAVLLFASATWIHATWYVLVLPAVACALAGHRRAGVRLAGSWAAGVALGALATGKPLAFLVQTLRHAYLALGHGEPAATLAGEFLPFSGSPQLVLAAAGLLLWRGRRGSSARPPAEDPVFVLAVCGWVLGFVTIRFWSDWGVPALLVWMALELQDVLEQRVPAGSPRRLLAAGAIAGVTLLAVTADAGGRWSKVDRTYTPLLRTEARPFLPDEGGILYSGDMRIFFETFFRHPRAPWRYAVGFEPGVMPPEDLAVYRQMLKGLSPEALAPWVRKMRPQDRLIVASQIGAPPVPGLQWQPVGGVFWSGRVIE